MKKRLQNLPAHLAGAWRNLIRHISLTVSSVIAVTVTLLIVGVLMVVAGNISDFTDNIESDFQIQATISPGFSDDTQIEELQHQIEELDHVSSCTFSSKEEELQELFDHTRPDGSSCFTALDEAGVRYWTAGENIAAGAATPESVMNMWMNSEGHRANILNESFDAIGVGRMGNYWVQMFVGG